jgi:hypothetical protein
MHLDDSHSDNDTGLIENGLDAYPVALGETHETVIRNVHVFRVGILKEVIVGGRSR